MARPERKNVDYFPHYISEGKKMFCIEQKYGNDGYAVWFKVLEMLAVTDDHWINLNDKSNLMFMSAKCRVSESVLMSILQDLADLNQINSELWSSKVVWSDKFTESIQDAYSRRNNKCITFEGLCQHLSSLGIHKQSKCKLNADKKPQSKVKDIKVEKSIEERKQDFASTLKPFLERYGREFLIDFYLYWSEETQDHKHLKYELEQTWSLQRRLKTWESNAKKFGTTLPISEVNKFKAAWE